MAGRGDFADWAGEQTPGLFRRALILTGDWHRAEDLVQETLAKLYVHWHRVDLEQNAAGYAMRTLFHVFVSDRRRRPGEATLVDVVPDRPEPGRDHELRLDLIRALDVLSPQERFVVVARYLDDLSVEEVATMLKRTRSWVRTTAHRATKRLQRSPGPLASLVS
ncbi:sigma-70 family RNA polymerase sigma factor [Microlunatus speluncae]|uniref:sigma-70 family RNA polymerase sigma factor n=1 Tax=Microlunatus speluncae TaxID=2594267 RepID=UPI0012664C19|nr:sigma-70 family RNA polymerase sigma factor [Microlunatus speluncae]